MARRKQDARRADGTEDGLDCLGNYGPVVFKVVEECCFIQNELVETLLERGEGNECVGYGDTNVAGDR